MREFKFRVYNNKTKSWVHGPGQEVNLFGEMNDNILGGRGRCEKCGKIENNVSYHEEHECGESKEQKLLDKILNEIRNNEAVAKLDYKQLADYIIQICWSKKEWGSYDECVLNRIIKILFELNDDYKEDLGEKNE